MADFTHPVSHRDPRFIERFSSVDNAYTTTGTKTITITPTAGLRSGFLRVKTKSVNASSVQQFRLKCTDGSSPTVIQPLQTATAAGEVVDLLRPFHLDIAATSFTLEAVVTGDGNLTIDFELAGCR